MLLCVAAVATFSSCSKDNEDLIVGKWEVVIDNFNANGNDAYSSDHSSRIGEIWEFKTGGVFSIEGSNGSGSTSYSVSGNNIVIMGGIMSGTITTLTKSKMVLDLEMVMTFGGNTPTEHIEFKKK